MIIPKWWLWQPEVGRAAWVPPEEHELCLVDRSPAEKVHRHHFVIFFAKIKFIIMIIAMMVIFTIMIVIIGDIDIVILPKSKNFNLNSEDHSNNWAVFSTTLYIYNTISCPPVCWGWCSVEKECCQDFGDGSVGWLDLQPSCWCWLQMLLTMTITAMNRWWWWWWWWW